MNLVASSSSPSSSSNKRKMDSDSSDESTYFKRPKNDVFMNYAFEDIGKSFISHLKGALSRNSFTISDHTLLTAGEDMRLELLKAIGESEIYVIVFSINYAFSERSLNELVSIMDRLNKFNDRKVLPVYYNVEPSDVRRQHGPFKEAFRAYDTDFDPGTVQKWKQALKDAGQLCGLSLQNGDEAKFVMEIVKELEKMQSPQQLHVTDYPVGIGSRAEELISRLRLDCKDVLVVAVFGIGGIGKTTIVKCAYNRVAANFDVSCFLADIHHHCGRRNWKVKLQKELISYLTRNDKHLISYSHNDGVTKIKSLISRRKVLLVLDDIDDFEQLEALGVDPKWFYDGSRIIVITRDKQSLGKIPYTSYHTRLLNRRESLNLFTRLMFARESPVNTKFVEEVVRHGGGLPLVLKVWSCHFKHYEKEQWPSIFETLKRIPHGDVQKQLQISYDSLTNRAKKLFLDSACFFVGMEKDLVVKVLQDEDSPFFPNNEIQYLVDKSLIEITGPDSLLLMHHAIRDMGREIVRQENEDEPGKRTRLWDETDVMLLLTECSGTESVESIRLRSFRKEELIVQVEAFKKMRNLRLIQLYQKVSFLTSSLDDLPSFCFKKLKYMEWHGFPFKCINIDMGNVVVLRLTDSKLEILWEGFKSLKKLRILDVRMSIFLTKTGDFYGLENLEELYFIDCINLKELHPSIGCLHRLAILDLHSSIPLNMIPWEMISNLQSLRVLKLGNTSLDSISEPDKLINHLRSSLKEYRITKPSFHGCPISDEVGSLAWLEHSQEKTFSSLPDSLLQLHQLKRIELVDYTNIRWIPNLPQSITYIKVYACTDLANLPSNMPNLKSLTVLDFHLCPKLGTEDPQLLMKFTGLTNLSDLTISGCSVSQVPSEIGNLVSLKRLDLSVNTFSSLPDSISNLSQLVDLNVDYCSRLRLLPLLPSNLTNIGAYGCQSLDVKSSSSVPTKVCKESPFTKGLVIRLSGEWFPDWCSCRGDVLSSVAPLMDLDKSISSWRKQVPDLCSYTYGGHVLSFAAPVHMEKKICGMILCATTTRNSVIHTITFKLLNRTKNTSHLVKDLVLDFDCSMLAMFYPLDDTTLLVEAGDTVVLEFPRKLVSSCGLRLCCGLRLIYESDVVDSKLVSQDSTERRLPQLVLIN
ncbi:hypothetical protein SSX86_026886 [Deinandra increscens subsp. villosa]|uniref:TIR domain-containing protein n=1 Tax=Deinandra increscens subsp. villosa TaxID=3103831 RepID=A0AAP0GNH9_9ASTR